MNHKNHNKVSVVNLHFKQWSHKGYAVFCSLGKVVHIGNLAISLTQWIGDVIEGVRELIQQSMDREVDEAAEELQEQELLQVIPVIISTPVECGIIVFSKFKNINCR